jgi:hypothetical protein
MIYSVNPIECTNCKRRIHIGDNVLPNVDVGYSCSPDCFDEQHEKVMRVLDPPDDDGDYAWEEEVEDDEE